MDIYSDEGPEGVPCAGGEPIPHQLDDALQLGVALVQELGQAPLAAGGSKNYYFQF